MKKITYLRQQNLFYVWGLLKENLNGKRQYTNKYLCKIVIFVCEQTLWHNSSKNVLNFCLVRYGKPMCKFTPFGDTSTHQLFQVLSNVSQKLKHTFLVGKDKGFLEFVLHCILIIHYHHLLLPPGRKSETQIRLKLRNC